MLAGARLLPFADGEIIQGVNTIPQAMGFITEGEADMYVTADDGRRLSLGELGVGDYIGGTSLTRQRMITGVVALTDTTIVAVSREAMSDIVQTDPRLARQIGEAIDMRRRAAREALAAAAEGVR
jgi:CRP-like cAMP-binding protein